MSGTSFFNETIGQTPTATETVDVDDFLSTGEQSTMTAEQINDFKALLQNLEASKKRQQRQRSVEGRRDIYAQGLASMMSNF